MRIPFTMAGIGIVSAAMLVLPTQQAGAGVADAPSNKGTMIALENAQGWSETEVDQIDADVSIEEVTTTYVAADGQQVTVGIVARDGQLPADLNAEVAGTLIDMGAMEPLTPAEKSGESTVRDKPMLQAALARAQADQTAYDRVLVPGAVDQLPPGLERFAVKEESSDLALMADADCPNTWWPNTLTVKAGKSSVEGRFGQTEFVWGPVRLGNLKCYEDVTFEPDFVTNRYDGLSYYSKTILAWSSTMPSNYWDTNFGDADEERVYTVGTSRASQLVADNTYRAYFRATAGNSGSDTVKINLQRGNRTPSYCDSTWCIFPRDTKRVPNSGWFDISGSIGPRTFFL